jgi:hypothetical protein
MPVMLDGSNININYSTSNFDIQSVKSELYIPDTTNNSGNIINVPIGMNEIIKQSLSYEPMNTNIIFEDFTFKTEEIRTFTHSGGTENQTTYNLNIPHDIICDILIVGGGGGGGGHTAYSFGYPGGGGGAGALIYQQNGNGLSNFQKRTERQNGNFSISKSSEEEILEFSFEL